MADDQTAIVQRMIDAGESEDNIATVIQHFKSQAPGAALAAANAKPLQEPTTYAGGVMKSLGDTAAKTGRGILEGATDLPKAMWNGLTNPNPGIPVDVQDGKLVDQRPKGPGALAEIKSLSDPEQGGRAIGNLAAGLALSVGARRGPDALQAVKDSPLSRVRVHPTALLPKRLTKLISIEPPPNPAQPLAQDIGPSVLHGADQFRESYGAPPERFGNEHAPTLSAEDRAALARQGFTPDLIDRVERSITPVASHPVTTAKTPSPTRMTELVSKFGGTAPESGVQAPPPNIGGAPLSQPLGTPRVIGPPGRWTLAGSTAREAPMPGQEAGWRSFAEPGTPEASRQSARHMELSQMDARYKHLISDPKAAWVPGAVLGNALRKKLLDALQD